MIATRMMSRTVAQSNMRAFSTMLAPASNHIVNIASGLGQHSLAAIHTFNLHESHLSPSLALRIQVANKATLPRDPDRPKLPLSGYMRFAAVYREKNSLKGGVETMKKIGAAWKELGDAEKKPFLDIAANDKRIYQKKFEEYKESGKLEAWRRDPAKPKKPNTAYLEWALERRKDPQLSKMVVTESSKLIAAEWSSLPQAQKDALQAKAKSKLEAYKREMQAYKASGKEEVWLERTGRLAVAKKAEEKAVKKKTQESAAKEKEKAKAAKEKEKLKLQKQKEKEIKAKVAAKKKADMEKMKAKKAKEAAKKKADMEKMKAKKAKEAAKIKADKENLKAKKAKQVAAAKKTKEVAAAKKAKAGAAKRAKEVPAKEKAKAAK